MDPHGIIDIQWRKNILLVKTRGPFNIEGITLAFDQLKASVKNKNQDPWYRVDFLDNETLGSQAVMQVIGESYKWSNAETNCIETAVCCSNVIQYELLTKFSHYASLNIKIFNNIDQANGYIEDKLLY